MSDINETLIERGQKYGPFVGHAEVTVRLKNVVREELDKRYKLLACDQLEALDMICHKIGRIINGDPDYDDSWVDIAGYAKLVADRLKRRCERHEEIDRALTTIVSETMRPKADADMHGFILERLGKIAEMVAAYAVHGDKGSIEKLFIELEKHIDATITAAEIIKIVDEAWND